MSELRTKASSTEAPGAPAGLDAGAPERPLAAASSAPAGLPEEERVGAGKQFLVDTLLAYKDSGPAWLDMCRDDDGRYHGGLIRPFVYILPPLALLAAFWLLPLTSIVFLALALWSCWLLHPAYASKMAARLESCDLLGRIVLGPAYLEDSFRRLPPASRGLLNRQPAGLKAQLEFIADRLPVYLSAKNWDLHGLILFLAAVLLAMESISRAFMPYPLANLLPLTALLYFPLFSLQARLHLRYLNCELLLGAIATRLQ